MCKHTVTRWLLPLAICLLTSQAFAQFYTGFSRMGGGSQVEEVTDLQLINGEAYLLGTTRSSNFISTNGSTYRGNLDITLTKYDANGTVLYASYLGGLGNDFATAMKIVNGEVFISLYTDSINFPVTNGSVFKGRRDVVVVKLTSTGNIAFATYLGGNGNDTPVFGGIEVNNDKVIIAGTTASINFPVTNGTTYNGGVNDGFAAILSATDGSLLNSSYYGGNKSDFVSLAVYDSNSIYLVAATFSQDIPGTIGSPLTDTLENVFIARLSFSNLSTIYARYLGGNKRDFITKAVVADGMLHLAGYTGSTDFPVSNGTSSSTQANDTEDGYYAKLNPDGNIVYATYLTTDGRDNPNQLIINNGDAYIGGVSTSTINGQLFVLASKIRSNGSLAYTRRYPIGTNNNNSVKPNFIVDNGELYLTGVSMSAEYPVTNQGQFFSGGTGFFTRLGANGELLYSGFLGSMTNLLQPVWQNNRFYLAGQTSIANYTITNGSTLSGGTDNILIILQGDGNRVFAGYYGGSGNELPGLLKADGQSIFIAGKTLSTNFPVTVNESYKGNGDQFITQVRACPTRYQLTIDSISPKTQIVCKQGLGQTLTGVNLAVPGDSLPLLFRNGVPTQQLPVPAVYQWQVAPSPDGPWSDIPSATFRDYTPTLGSGNLYYRRAAFTLPYCGSSFIHYSDTASAIVNDLTAPSVDAGSTLVTCPGFPVTIGGNPTAIGGNPPYVSYNWDQGAASVSNPVVAPAVSTLYTVTVTDNLGCRQLGQAVVLTYAAAAGPDQGACGGIPARIGTPLIPGLPGLQYNWQPAASLNNAQIPQPLASPTGITDYILTLSVPVSSGGTCQTTDTVRVTPVAAPVTANFAGPDRVFCLGSSALLGLAPETGFNYVWSPGNYLTSNTLSTTTYYAGNVVMPVPNPAIINVTAQKSGCFFPDQVIVSTIEARAGRDGCGPRIIGLPDRTPNINETYSWTKISGSGDFTGPTNLPQVPVSASIGTPTTYRLTVTYNGQSCSDDVTVPPFCSNCQTQIFVDAQYSCPSYSANGGNVSLIAFSSIDNAIFSWSPREGLTNYTGNVVQLTDNVPRLYTVTAMDANDSTFFCTDNILVNDPAFVRPVFPAPDTITCSGQPVMIGAPSVAGYTYEWLGTGLSSNLVSNPVATVSTSTSYPITVTDIGGCILKDTVLITVQNALVNAGPDRFLCSSGIVRLGTASQPNTTYVWEPQSSPWQNNTNQFSAQPEVLVATNLSFYVTATTSAGCTIRDTVAVTINSNPSIADAPDTSTCLGTAVRIGSPAISGVTYQWSPATGLNSATVAQPLANPASTTTYTVVATFPGNCNNPATDQVTVTVRSAAFSMPDIIFCPDNGPVSLGINAPPNMTSYSWQPSQAVNIANIANPSTLNPPPKVPSNFTLLVSNPNGCQYRDTIQIIPSVMAPQAGTDRLICKGDSIILGTSANTTGTGITYSWSPVAFLNDPASPNPQFMASSGGVFTYILTKTDNNINCSSRDTVIITVQDIGFNLLNNAIACQNSCIQIGTTPVTGITYQWTPATGLSNPTVANPLACIETGTANYTLTASNINGCAVSQQVVIGVSPVPAAQISIPPVTGCTGDTTLQFNPSINPPGPYRYLWSPNDGSLSNIQVANPRIRVTAPGSRQYQLLVTDTVSGCSNTASASLSISNCDPNSVIGDFAWFDLNANGLQDTGEPGVSGMTVNLFNAAGFNVASTTTNPAGLYFFSNVPPGNGYYVIFSLPQGYMFTDQLVGGTGSLINSKANDSGRTQPFNVPPGASILNIDAGIRVCGGGGPVPVTLLSFSASAVNRSVMLYWQTTAEYNNDYFDIQRSQDGVRFTSIGRMAGHGTTTIPQSYQWPDKTPLNGMNYYRLRQADIDGRSTYSKIIPVHFNNPAEIFAYYDPGSHSIPIHFNRAQATGYALLFAPNGQRVAGIQISKNESDIVLKLPVLANGAYTLLIDSDQLFYSRQILISR